MIKSDPVLCRLARPVTETERHRARLVSTAVAGAGVFLLAAVAIATVPGPRLVERAADGTAMYQLDPAVRTLAPFLNQGGIGRGGYRAAVIGALLLVVVFVLFAVQALRTGTVARERRLAALSVAGATRPQLRRLAALEGMRAAGAGGLLAGPGYLVLWLILGVALPSGARLLLPLGPAVVAAWPVTAVVLMAAGAAAAALAARPATVSPLGFTRRAKRPLEPGGAVLPVIGLLVALGGLVPAYGSSDDAGAFVVLALAGALGFALTGGRWLVLLAGRIAVGRGLVTSLAGHRLLADVRSPGRVAGVLFATGLALAVLVEIGATELDEARGADAVAGSTVGAFGAAAVTIVLAALIASASLAVGASEQVLDGRRATAVLVALAAAPRFVQQVVRRQLLLAAVPAAVLGALTGWLVITDLGGGRRQQLVSLSALLVAVLAATLVAGAGALVAAGAVGPAIRDSSTPDNLRAP